MTAVERPVGLSLEDLTHHNAAAVRGIDRATAFGKQPIWKATISTTSATPGTARTQAHSPHERTAHAAFFSVLLHCINTILK